VVYLGYTELVGAVVVASVSTVVALVDTADAVNLYFAADDHAVLVIAVEAQVTGDFPVGYIVVVVVVVVAAAVRSTSRSTSKDRNQLSLPSNIGNRKFLSIDILRKSS